MEVRNRFQLLGVEEGPNAMYERFVAAHVEATRECVPVMEKARTSLVQASGGHGGKRESGRCSLRLRLREDYGES